MKQQERGTRRRRKSARQREKRAITIICIFLGLVILALGSYAAGWYANRARIRRDSTRYRDMYNSGEDAPTQAPNAKPTQTTAPKPTEAPTAKPTKAPTPEPTEAPTASPTQAPTAKPTEAPTAKPTEAPTAEPTQAPTAEPTEAPTPEPTQTPLPMPAASDEPIPTPNADTRVFALPTVPPVQQSFAQLIEHNAETVGFLDIEDMLSLPVVQRENDNDYYLNHNFDGEESLEGALFLDGMNRLVPEDDCLIVYGHNMKNGTMFGPLHEYEDPLFLKKHPIVRFDTIYENRLYVPFAAFPASMSADDRQYFEVRRFLLDETEFELFVLKMQTRSVREMPVDVRYGDRLLLLVTCDYTSHEGRFILGLRQLRPDETEDDVRALFAGED